MSLCINFQHLLVVAAFVLLLIAPDITAGQNALPQLDRRRNYQR